MAVHQIKRLLRVAFTAAELQFLEGLPEFSAALDSSANDQDSIKSLITLGGALLARTSSQDTAHLRQRCNGESGPEER